MAPKTNPPAVVTKASDNNARCQPEANPTNAFSLAVAFGGLDVFDLDALCRQSTVDPAIFP